MLKKVGTSQRSLFNLQDDTPKKLVKRLLSSTPSFESKLDAGAVSPYQFFHSGRYLYLVTRVRENVSYSGGLGFAAATPNSLFCKGAAAANIDDYLLRLPLHFA